MEPIIIVRFASVFGSVRSALWPAAAAAVWPPFDCYNTIRACSIDFIFFLLVWNINQPQFHNYNHFLLLHHLLLLYRHPREPGVFWFGGRRTRRKRIQIIIGSFLASSFENSGKTWAKTSGEKTGRTSRFIHVKKDFRDKGRFNGEKWFNLIRLDKALATRASHRKAKTSRIIEFVTKLNGDGDSWWWWNKDLAWSRRRLLWSIGHFVNKFALKRRRRRRRRPRESWHSVDRVGSIGWLNGKHRTHSLFWQGSRVSLRAWLGSLCESQPRSLESRTSHWVEHPNFPLNV